MSQSHLEIYNSTFDERHRDFPEFSLLPTELRLQIWRHALQHYRLIRIKIPYLADDTGAAEELPIVQSHQMPSKILGVNSEARETAVRFYRVRIPCEFESGKTVKSGTLMLNPEFDILHIRPGWARVGFAELISRMRAVDPLQIGILNLALESQDVKDLMCCADLSRLTPTTREALKVTISQLELVFFFYDHKDARHVYERLDHDVVAMIHQAELYMSCPVLLKIPFVDLEPSNLQPISENQLRVLVCTIDPRKIITWCRLLQKWEIPQIPMSRYRLLGFARCLNRLGLFCENPDVNSNFNSLIGIPRF
ncbi:hypothetical protein F4677DRAFT_304492 [Hypoxylon crocopeplum]|nr:hypothetical protein F4677DRAFT_304492 [Hypoxylon crocopeplum]